MSPFLSVSSGELAAAAGSPEMIFIHPLSFLSYEKIAFDTHFQVPVFFQEHIPHKKVLNSSNTCLGS